MTAQRPRLLIQRSERASVEGQLALAFAREHALDWVDTWTKAITHARVDIHPTDIAIGTLAFVHARLRMDGRTPPAPNDYPLALRTFLHRTVTQMRLRDAQRLVAEHGRRFVKPAAQHKRFTGFVAQDPHDARWFGMSAHLPVWVSDVLAIASEWRVYVAHGDVLAVCAAPGTRNDATRPDPDVTRQIADTLHCMPDGYDGVVFDLGVLVDGRTVLIEVNEGYAFGAYAGVPPDAFVAPQIARQLQLLTAELAPPT